MTQSDNFPARFAVVSAEEVNKLAENAISKNTNVGLTIFNGKQRNKR